MKQHLHIAMIVADRKICDLHQVLVLIIKENLIHYSILIIFKLLIPIGVIAYYCCFLFAIILTRY
jgi:hypothetical protein